MYLGVLLRDLLGSVAQHEPDRDDHVVASRGKLLDVLFVVRRLLGLDERTLQPELFDSSHHTLIGELVEGTVVHLANVGH